MKATTTIKLTIKETDFDLTLSEAKELLRVLNIAVSGETEKSRSINGLFNPKTLPKQPWPTMTPVPLPYYPPNHPYLPPDMDPMKITCYIQGGGQ